MPERVDVRHMVGSRVTVAERLAHLRALVRRGSFSFDDAVVQADRVTIAVTLYALLELRVGAAHRFLRALELRHVDEGQHDSRDPVLVGSIG